MGNRLCILYHHFLLYFTCSVFLLLTLRQWGRQKGVFFEAGWSGKACWRRHPWSSCSYRERRKEPWDVLHSYTQTRVMQIHEGPIPRRADMRPCVLSAPDIKACFWECEPGPLRWQWRYWGDQGSWADRSRLTLRGCLVLWCWSHLLNTCSPPWYISYYLIFMVKKKTHIK